MSVFVLVEHLRASLALLINEPLLFFKQVFLFFFELDAILGLAGLMAERSQLHGLLEFLLLPLAAELLL